MSADTLIHEAPVLSRSVCDEDAAWLADHFATPQPATSDGGSNGAHIVTTLRGLPDPEPQRPQRGHMTASEWSLIDAGELSGREAVVNCLLRNGGPPPMTLMAEQSTGALPVIPEIVYVDTAAQDDATHEPEPATVVWFAAALASVFLAGFAVGVVLMTLTGGPS